MGRLNAERHDSFTEPFILSLSSIFGFYKHASNLPLATVDKAVDSFVQLHNTLGSTDDSSSLFSPLSCSGPDAITKGFRSVLRYQIMT